MRQKISVEVNGKEYEREVEPRTLLVHWLRDDLGLTGTNVGCETSLCGACTVWMDGLAVKSCTQLAVQADGTSITTIEGLGEGTDYHPMQQAFWDEHGLQCGFCTPGMIMAGAKLVEGRSEISDTEVREGLKGNVCRCTGYQNIVSAIQLGAKGGA